MPHYTPPRRSATPPSYPYSHNYPGIAPYEADSSEVVEASALVPYSPANADPIPTSTKTGGGFSIPNLGDLKGMIDRLGGIDGIVATMTKVQKIMQTVQQFAPMAKMFTGLLPGAKGLKLQGGNSDDNLDEYKPRRGKGKGRKSSKKGRKRSSSRPRNGKAPAKKRR